MENASKALIMAGGVLIAMMIMAIGIYLFTQYSQMGSQYTTKMSAQETASFNSNFTVFEGRTNITAQEIVSLTNFAKDYKEKTEIEVSIYVGGSGNLTEKNKTELTDFVKENNSKDYSYNKIEYDGPFDTVSSISFVQN